MISVRSSMTAAGGRAAGVSAAGATAFAGVAAGADELSDGTVAAGAAGLSLRAGAGAAVEVEGANRGRLVKGWIGFCV